MKDDRYSRVARAVPNVDVRKLPLSAHEGYVLSRVDGFSRVDELALVTALSDEMAYEILEKLVLLGAVEWKEAPAAKKGPAPAPPISDQPVTKSAPTPVFIPPYSRKPSGEPKRSTYSAELGEATDLDQERKMEILEMWRRLDTSNYYDVLGVAPTAEKKDIRMAYFELSKRFHPDTLFRKNLGTFKPKMEGIFNKLTEAYEVLGKQKTRFAYDEYLALAEQTSDAKLLLEAGEETAVEEAKRASQYPMPDEDNKGISSFPDEITIERGTLEPNERKRLVQERWRKALTNAPAAVAYDEEGNVPSNASTVRDDLARSLAQIANVTGGIDPIRRHLSSARLAEETGNLVEAVNFARLAQALAPERSDVIKEHERLRLLLAAQLADSYEKQAEYEESHDKWQAASMSWAQVCAGRPTDAHAHARAAEAYLRVGTDLRAAKTFAEKAAGLLPNDARPRVALGRIYLALDLKLNAKRELETALRIDPTSEQVRNLLRDL